MSTHFLATPLGKKIIISSKIPQPAEVRAKNIIKPSFDDLSAEQCQDYEAWKKEGQEQLDTLEKKLKEEFETLKKQQEEEDMKSFLSGYKKDRQGVTVPVGENKLPPMLRIRAEPTVSLTSFLRTK